MTQEIRAAVESLTVAFEMLEAKPLFELVDGAGKRWAVYADGRTEGFPEGTAITNRALPLVDLLRGLENRLEAASTTRLKVSKLGLRAGSRGYDATHAAEEVERFLERVPLFEIKGGNSFWKIYRDGRIEGFPAGSVVTQTLYALEYGLMMRGRAVYAKEVEDDLKEKS